MRVTGSAGIDSGLGTAARASTRAFPKPITRRERVWTATAVLYAVAVVASAVYEAQWLMDFDPGNGAPIPFLTVLVTAPGGWIGLTAAAAVTQGLDVAGTTGIAVTWTTMAVFGLLQCWGVWRIGMQTGLGLRKNGDGATRR